jgi:FixJ family two-component response regulator
MVGRELVVLVDDDESVREAVPDLLQQWSYEAMAFASAAALLAWGESSRAACLILDVAMPGMTGVELYRELVRRGQAAPTIFITAHADVTDRALLLQEGAVDCLFKPFSERDLLGAVASAVRAKARRHPP